MCLLRWKWREGNGQIQPLFLYFSMHSGRQPDESLMDPNMLGRSKKGGDRLMPQRRRISALLKQFAAMVQQQRDELLQEWRRKVSLLPAAKNLDTPTLNDHIPHLFDELALALTSGESESVLDLQLSDSPKIHGGLRLRAGFDIVEVVAEYNILRELLLSLAERQGLDITGDPNRILNR